MLDGHDRFLRRSGAHSRYCQSSCSRDILQTSAINKWSSPQLMLLGSVAIGAVVGAPTEAGLEFERLLGTEEP